MNKEVYTKAKKMYIEDEKSIRSIAKDLGINRKRLSNKLKDEGIKTGKLKRYTNDVLNKAKGMLDNGKSITNIADTLNLDRGVLSQQLDKKGYRDMQEPSYLKYDYEGDMALNMVIDYQNDLSMQEIADKYDKNTFLVLRILEYHNIDTKNDNRKYNLNQKSFDVIDSEEKAYWLGFLFADGYVYSDISHKVELTLQQRDREHVVAFQSFLGTNAPVYEKDISLPIGEYRASRIDVCSKHLVESLEDLGCTQAKSLTLEFPNIPKKLVNHFMRGYFDGDGSISIRNDERLEFEVLSTKSFLDDYYNHLPVTFKPKYRRHGSAYGLRYIGDRVVDIYNFLYKDSNIFLKRKRDKFSAVYDGNIIEY